ncbi:MAG: hypothetical protein WAL29_12190 [Bacteroidales bacterium]
MKKPFLIAVLLVALLYSGYSQDKIITLSNDTIECRINRVSRSTIYFEMINRGIKSSARLPLGNILSYTVAGKTGPAFQDASAGEESFTRLRLGLNAGPGYMLAGTKKAIDQMISQGFAPDKAKSYYNDLKLGISFTGDAAWMITPDYGAGIRYKFMTTSAGTEGFMDPQDGIHIYYTSYDEKIYVNYGGVAFFYRLPAGKSESLVLSSSCSLGLATYRNEAGYLRQNFLLTGKNIGAEFCLGLEYSVTRHLSAGAELSAFYSTLKKVKVSDGSESATVDLDKDNFENLSRLDFSAGIKIYLW